MYLRAVAVFATKTFELGHEEIDIGDGFKVGLCLAWCSPVGVIRFRHWKGAGVSIASQA